MNDLWVLLWWCDDDLVTQNNCSLPADMNTRNTKISTYLRCAICAAVALGGPPICDPTEKTSSSDIPPSFVSCWSATRFAIFAEVRCGQKVKMPLDRFFNPQISSLSDYGVLDAFSSATARLRVAVLKSVRERPHPVGALCHRDFSVVLAAFTISRSFLCDTRFRIQGAS